ncbi:hypothetical protein ANN_09913 [Periplaneta americana]|uniref:Uncharacterized protein n=1 Tax=Periplaneta americana TaxID=6978 RepID=A0ABQ8TQM0_PERAM|nr:hypothetical protein ANN_09913 [Periplaneta americana]
MDSIMTNNFAINFIILGDKKLRIPVLDPLEITEINIRSGPRQAGLSMDILDIKFDGLRDLVLEDTHFDFKENIFHLKFHSPRNTLTGRYNISGRLLLLPIFGSGLINVTMVGSALNYTVNFSVYEKNGSSYFKSSKHHTTFEPTKATIYLENLFNGDRLLGNQMNELLTENWRAVFKDLEPPIAGAIADTIGNVVNTVAFNVPLDKVFIGGIPQT